MRFVLHTLYSLLFLAVMVVVASLLCYILMSLVGFLHFVTACIICGIVGAIAGIFALGGPITLSKNGYVPKGAEKTKTKVETFREKSWTTHYRCKWCGMTGKVNETSSVKTGEENS